MTKHLRNSAVMVALSMSCTAGPATALQMSAAPMAHDLPNMTSITRENAAGVLRFCVHNHLVSVTGADAVLKHTKGKKDLSHSSDYIAGEKGTVLTQKGPFSVAHTRRHLQSAACDEVLRQAKRF